MGTLKAMNYSLNFRPQNVRLSNGKILRVLELQGNIKAGPHVVGSHAIGFSEYRIADRETTIINISPGAIHFVGRSDGPAFVADQDIDEFLAIIGADFPSAFSRIRVDAAKQIGVTCEGEERRKTCEVNRTVLAAMRSR